MLWKFPIPWLFVPSCHEAYCNPPQILVGPHEGLGTVPFPSVLHGTCHIHFRGPTRRDMGSSYRLPVNIESLANIKYRTDKIEVNPRVWHCFRMYTKVQAVPLVENQAVHSDIQRGLFQQTEHLHNTDHMMQPFKTEDVKKVIFTADLLAQAALC